MKKYFKQLYFCLFQGDLVMQCDHLFEFLTKLSVVANKQNVIKVVQGR